VGCGFVAFFTHIFCIHRVHHPLKALMNTLDVIRPLFHPRKGTKSGNYPGGALSARRLFLAAVYFRRGYQTRGLVLGGLHLGEKRETSERRAVVT
jgi:hypothetical protein